MAKPLRSLKFPWLEDVYTVPNPIVATEDMTQPVGVDVDGLLFTAPGGGGKSALPAMSEATAGQYLTNDGTSASWVTIINGEEVTY